MSQSENSISEDHVLEKLKNVIDPELFVNIVDLGLIYGVVVGADEAPAENKPEQKRVDAEAGQEAQPEGVCVKIEMTMTSPACPAGPQLISGAKKEVGSIAGVGGVDVKIVLDPPWTPDRMTEDAKDQLGIF